MSPEFLACLHLKIRYLTVKIFRCKEIFSWYSDFPQIENIAEEVLLAKLQERFGKCQEALKSKGLKVDVDKIETMVCAKTAGRLPITDRKRKILKQVENVGYLGSMIHTTAGSEGAWIKGHWTKNHKKEDDYCDKKTSEADVYT